MSRYFGLFDFKFIMLRNTEFILFSLQNNIFVVLIKVINFFPIFLNEKFSILGIVSNSFNNIVYPSVEHIICYLILEINENQKYY